MAAVLEARAVISAEDRTKAAFDAIKARVSALSGQILALDRATGSIGRAMGTVNAVRVPSDQVTAEMGRMVDSARGLSKVSASVEAVERSFAATTASASRSTAAVADLTATLSDAEKKLKAIESYRGGHRGLDAPSIAFRTARQNVRRLEAEIAGAEAPTSSMRAAFASAQTEAAKAREMLALQGAEARKARAALDEVGIPFRTIASEEEKLRKVVDETTAAIQREVAAERERVAAGRERLQEERNRRERKERTLDAPEPGHRPEPHGEAHARGAWLHPLAEMGAGIAPMVGLGAAYEGEELVRHAVHGGFERQHERVRMETSGMKPGEIADTEALSANLAAKYTPIGQTEIMHLMRNARSVVGSYDEAAKIVQPLLDLRMVAQGAHPGQNMEEDFDQLIKGMEIKGVTQDPKQFRSYINAMGKAVNAFGDTLRPTDFYEMFKYGRQSTSGFSEDYMMTVAPTLAQEMKGSSAGVANSAFFRAIVGGRMEKGALARLIDLGLVDRSKLVTPKGGHLASAAGAVKGSALAQINPYEWVNQILLPAMKKKGIVDPAKIQEVINSVFSNQVAAQMVGIYATQQARIEKDRDVIAHTQDTSEAARNIMMHDPIIAAEGLKNAIGNLGSVFADKELHLAGTMTRMAESIGRFTASLQQRHEDQEKGERQPTEGQKKFNGWLNWFDNELSGRPQTGSRASWPEARREAAILQAEQDEATDPALQKQLDAKRAEAARLRADAETHDDKTFWGSVFHHDDTGPKERMMAKGLENDADDLQQELDRSKRAAQIAHDLDKVDTIQRSMENSRYIHEMEHPPEIKPGLPEGPLKFPMSVGPRSYADLPLPADLRPGMPAPEASPGTPEAPRIGGMDQLKALLNGGHIAPDVETKGLEEVSTKATEAQTKLAALAGLRVAPEVSSAGIDDFIRKADVAQQKLSALGRSSSTSGSLGPSYPSAAPTGRNGSGR